MPRGRPGRAGASATPPVGEPRPGRGGGGSSFADIRPDALVDRADVRIRTTEPTDLDCARMADLLNAAFGRSVHTAREYRTLIERSPSFDHALNLVTTAPDGTFAAHVGVTYDGVNRHGIVEPVCTDPRFRRHGLARSLLLEGLRRLAGRGAETAQVDTGELAAPNALYVDCGFTEGHHLHRWSRPRSE